jgi:hypothetical protein
MGRNRNWNDEPGNQSNRVALPRILDVGDVCRRYRLCDARAARRMMWAAGAFIAGKRLLVREDDLDRWEREHARRVERVAPAGQKARGSGRRPATAPGDQGLKAGWWRDEAELSGEKR